MSDLTPESSFERLKGNVVKSIQANFPIEGRKNILVMENVQVHDNLDVSDIKGQLDAKDKDGTWAVPVKGDLKLIDKATGKVIDHKKGAVLARLPKLTSRYGYIVGGTEYQVDHLFKLKSGVYTRVKQNGELETEYNLADSSTGRGFALNFDPKTMKFNMEYPKGSGGISLPLYPVMKSMGVSDEELEHSWGKQVFDINKTKNDKTFYAALKKFWVKTSDDDKKTEPSQEALMVHMRSFFDAAKLRPDTTKITMGKSFESVTAEALQIGASKVLGISKGTHKPDERDSLAFKEVVSIDDFLPTKINKAMYRIKAKVRNNIDSKAEVSAIIQPDIFGKHINEFFTGGKSGVSERSEQTNPLQMLSAHTKTTIMSKDFGGLKNDQSIGDEMRVISPSHFGFLDPSHTPEGERTGTTLHLSSMARKSGNDLEIPVYDTKSKKAAWSTVGDFHTKTAVLPDQVTWHNGHPVPVSANVKVKLPGGSMETRPFKDADYVMASAKGVFDHATNLIPFLASDQGNRVSMAAKQMEQAIGLKHREAPLVQCKTDNIKDPGHTYEKVVGSFVANKSPLSGKVTKVTPDSITIKGEEGEHSIQIYNHFPLNDQKVMMHSTSLVKEGDIVKKGQVVADSNFTKNGTLATGINLRYGLMGYKGYNFDDGVVISETAAKKLTSEHLYSKHLELDSEKDIISATKLRAFAPVSVAKMPKEHWNSLDKEGVIKVGEKVHPGQILVAALGENKQGRATLLSRLGTKAIKPYKDKSLMWDEDHVGEVTRVVRLPSGDVKVFVKTDEPMVIGDKIAGRHGDKGIITAILPDHEMPFTKDEKGEKKPLELMFNPLGIPSRINVGQMFEIGAAKIAEKTGKPYIVSNFSGRNHHADITADMAKHGLNDEEQVFDPSNPNKAMGSVMVGPKYTFKLRHQVEKKLHVRGGGTTVEGRPLPYGVDRQPSKGGEYGGQGYGQLDLYALLGHDARNNIREMSTYKSDLQDTTFWNLIQEGHEPPPPRPPFTYEKFTALLRGAGVNVTKEGTAIKLSPMTDQETLKLAGNGKNQIVKESRTAYGGNLMLRAKDLKEEKDGLFDPVATGGMDGSKWSYFKLAEPIPNPIFVGQGNTPGPVPVLLGLKRGELDAIMEGTQKLDGKIGGTAIRDALKKIDVNKQIDSIRSTIKDLRGGELDRENRKLRFLLALQDQKLKPHEAYIMNYAPVIPPKFRPITEAAKGDAVVAPLNNLYKNAILMNDQLLQVDPGFSSEHKNPLRSHLWNAMKAISSVGSYKPVYDSEGKGDRELVGILDQLATGGGEGGQPKKGFVQDKLVKRRQNLSMRSTIVPEPNLHMDEVGLPRGPAMELYKPYVVAQLGRWGVTPLDAQQKIKNGDDLSHKALEKVVEERPLILKRDPVLHKFNVIGLRPKLVDGKAIQIHPLVTGGMNADFDGDTCAITIPMSKAAVEEVKKMYPSNNIFSPASGDVMPVPTQETLLGLHLLSKWGKDTGKSFKDLKSLVAAVESGQAHTNDVVKVSGMFGGKPTTYGRVLLESRMPRTFEKNKEILHDSAFEITAKTMRGTLAPMLAKGHADEFSRAADALKDLGNEHVYKMGFSVGLRDIAPLKEKDAILSAAHKKVAALGTTGDKGTIERKTIDIYQQATSDINDAIKTKMKATGNRFGTMVLSGAKGKAGQLQQIIAAPMLMQDGLNNTIPTPVTKSYSEGLDIGDYWLAQHGARKGTIQKTLSSSQPGALTKDILNATMGTLITSQDCGTKNGILLGIVPDPKDPAYKDVHDRYLAQSVKVKNETIKEGTLITPEILSKMRNHKVSKIVVRSPLKCEHGDGICAKCYGIAENGKLHANGTNIGSIAGQALGEPATQMSLDSFHSGGVASGRGGASVDRISRLTSLLTMPETVKHQATVSGHTGKVTAIHDAEAGGVRVMVDNVAHYVPRPLVDPDIKVGAEVKKGDKLSGGYINPHHLLATTKDIHSVQNYLTKEMHEGLYDSEGVKRRNVEVAVRSLTNLTKVLDPGHSPHESGDIIPRSVAEEYNKDLVHGQKPMTHMSILKGSEQIPALLTQNWMGRLNYRELQKTILEAAGKGEKAELHGSHPIAGVMYGAEFGLPTANKPKHVY